MTAPLYLIELRPDPAALIRFAEAQGINRREDEDLGYATHAWLTALFGGYAPKPFRIYQDRRNLRTPRLLGFTRASGIELADHAHAFAPPLAMGVSPFDREVPAKSMPPEWSRGRRLGFELLACPISRLRKNEDDVYRRHRRECEQTGDKPASRADVYRDWLIRQLSGACRLEDYRLDGFRYLHLLRRTKGREWRRFLAPQAAIGGTLWVEDGIAFDSLLARGVGRHRAFGFGMLLLKPAS